MQLLAFQVTVRVNAAAKVMKTSTAFFAWNGASELSWIGGASFVRVHGPVLLLLQHKQDNEGEQRKHSVFSQLDACKCTPGTVQWLVTGVVCGTIAPMGTDPSHALGTSHSFWRVTDTGAFTATPVGSSNKDSQ